MSVRSVLDALNQWCVLAALMLLVCSSYFLFKAERGWTWESEDPKTGQIHSSGNGNVSAFTYYIIWNHTRRAESQKQEKLLTLQGKYFEALDGRSSDEPSRYDIPTVQSRMSENLIYSGGLTLAALLLIGTNLYLSFRSTKPQTDAP